MVLVGAETEDSVVDPEAEAVAPLMVVELTWSDAVSVSRPVEVTVRVLVEDETVETVGVKVRVSLTPTVTVTESVVCKDWVEGTTVKLV